MLVNLSYKVKYNNKDINIHTMIKTTPLESIVVHMVMRVFIVKKKICNHDDDDDDDTIIYIFVVISCCCIVSSVGITLSNTEIP